MKGYQFVNWVPNWIGFYYLPAQNDMKYIYDWFLGLGFLEIRKWHQLTAEDKIALNKAK